MSADSPADGLADEVAQQRALGGRMTRSETTCAVCDESGVFVSRRQVPASGPVRPDGYELHAVDGGTVYHQTDADD